MHLHPSAKSDHYLNLCLKQAALSPLNYRHVAVVVKGGKVLGAGFNDYRSGFDGSSNSSGTASPLSMHSEMMAIHAALGGKAAGNKASRGTKQSRVAVEEYVETVLRAALPPSYINARKHNSQPSLTEMAEGGNRVKNGKNRRNVGNRSGRKTRRKRQQQLPAVSRSSSTSFSGNDDIKSDNDCAGRQRRSSSRSWKTSWSRSTIPKNSPGRSPSVCNVPKAKRDVQHRERLPRLAGADLHVARLGKSGTCHHRKIASAGSADSASTAATTKITTATVRVAAALATAASTVTTTTKPSTGSLQDELNQKHPRSSPCNTPNMICTPTGNSTGIEPGMKSTATTRTAGKVTKSRPCYRCISYMRAVGIKRVFWTNSGGVREGAKVRDLVDWLEATQYGSGSGSPGTDFGSMFVTKHEVLLMLRAPNDGNR